MAGTAANFKRRVYIMIYNSLDLGHFDGIDPSKLKLQGYPIKSGSTGADLKLGMRITGMEGTLDAELRELTLANIKKLHAHYSSGDSIPLIPPINTDTYTLSQALKLHPKDLDIAVTTEDINFLHAYPLSPFLAKRDGKGDDVLPVSFEFYPDRTIVDSTGQATYGYFGTIPA